MVLPPRTLDTFLPLSPDTVLPSGTIDTVFPFGTIDTVLPYRLTVLTGFAQQAKLSGVLCGKAVTRL